VIPFDYAKLNEGGAFNLSSGIFTVPILGIYHFDLSAYKSIDATSLDIHLQLNGEYVGMAYAKQIFSGTPDAVSLSASLRLAKDDRVSLLLRGSIFVDRSHDHWVHFTGWLVEEELM